MEEDQSEILDHTIKKDNIISVRSLGSGFPANLEQARLAYAQSSYHQGGRIRLGVASVTSLKIALDYFSSNYIHKK